MSRLSYYKRVLTAYLTKRKSQLTFWHGTPQVNENLDVEKIGEYYMPLTYAAAENLRTHEPVELLQLV